MQDRRSTPGDKSWHDNAVRSREAAPPSPVTAMSRETERRRAQMKQLGDVVAERYRELRQKGN